MLDKVISGGQTGADQAAWRVARAFGVPTGGWMPLGFLTETPDGKGAEPHPEFAELDGAREMTTAAGADRTRANVQESDATLWVGATDTPGARATLTACRQLGKSVCQVAPGYPLRPSHVAQWIQGHRGKVLNVAGNRASTAPNIGPRVERFLGEVLRRLGYQRG